MTLIRPETRHFRTQKIILYCTVKQLEVQMGRKFFQRYSRKYFRPRTGSSFYCLVGEISSLLGKIDIFHN